MTQVSPLDSHGFSSSRSVSPSASDQSSAPSALSARSFAAAITPPASQTIAERMHKYEDLLRDAHVAGLELSLALRQTQTEKGLTAITGHAMFARFDEAQMQVGMAIASTAMGHRLARTLAPIAGIDPVAYGETTDPENVAGVPLKQVA